jgi:hypothetical protein
VLKLAAFLLLVGAALAQCPKGFFFFFSSSFFCSSSSFHSSFKSFSLETSCWAIICVEFLHFTCFEFFFVFFWLTLWSSLFFSVALCGACSMLFFARLFVNFFSFFFVLFFLFFACLFAILLSVIAAASWKWYLDGSMGLTIFCMINLSDLRYFPKKVFFVQEWFWNEGQCSGSMTRNVDVEKNTFSVLQSSCCGCPSPRRVYVMQKKCFYLSRWSLRPIQVDAACCQGKHLQDHGNRDDASVVVRTTEKRNQPQSRLRPRRRDRKSFVLRSKSFLVLIRELLAV